MEKDWCTSVYWHGDTRNEKLLQGTNDIQPCVSIKQALMHVVTIFGS